MGTTLTERFGAELDLGSCLVGRNLNLTVVRGFASLRELAAISAPDVFDQATNPNGTQRELDKGHANECHTYASEALVVPGETDPRSFPEIILNARDANVVELYRIENPDELVEFDSVSGLTEADAEMVGVRILVKELTFPSLPKSPQVSRVDGNHRLHVAGLLDDDVDDSSDRSSPLVPFALYVGLNTDQEIKLFKDINGEHKGMDVKHLASATLRIEDPERMKSDEKLLPLWLADQLAQPGRAFAGMVFYGGAAAGVKAETGSKPPIGINTLSSTIKQLLRSAPATTKAFEGQPEALLNLLDHYWNAVRSAFPEAWGNKREYILLQTIGLTGFARLGGVLLDRATHDGQAKQDYFEDALKVVAGSVSLVRSDWQGIAGAGGAAKVGEDLIGAADEDAAKHQRMLKELGVVAEDDGVALDNLGEGSDGPNT